ncbi:uncharacterized protein [Antedon mediterranea]|uniref:uncharacterized protein n=1 Tax=Antedon mediterranea TaxID=105859 RepID=UPI003AF4E824
MEVLSSTSATNYSDTFDSISSVTEAISPEKTTEDRYTSDTFDSHSTEESTSSYQSEASVSDGTQYSKHSLERTRHSYIEDTFESTSEDYSSNFSSEEEDESTKDSLSSENQLESTFCMSLIKKAKKNASREWENELKSESDVSIVPVEVHEYCKNKIQFLKNAHTNKPKVEVHHQSSVYTVQGILPITKKRLEEMKIENIRHKMKKKLDKVIEHDVNSCPACIKAQEVLAQKQFINAKKTHLQNKLIDERIQKHLETLNSVSLIGELAANLPKLSDDPKQVWSLLLNK